MSVSNDAACDADFWAQTFGTCIRGARQAAGISMEQAADLAGMRFIDWIAMETGHLVPSTRRGLEAVARAAGMPWSEMVSAVVLCRHAWGV